MVSPQNTALGTSSVHKIVQRISENAQKPPSDAVTIEVLKLMELHLQKRGLIPESVGTTFRYLWFVAETERNVFLWRNGLSIADANNFEFWIQVSDLIQKRLNQLASKDNENPFINPLWGAGTDSESSMETEKQYLEMFLEIFKRSAHHAHAICSMSKLLAKEVGSYQGPTVAVVLPRGVNK
jgi:hypothetical protein